MTRREAAMIYQTGPYSVRVAANGFEVYRDGVTAAERVAVIGYKGPEGIRRAIDEADRRAAADQAATNGSVHPDETRCTSRLKGTETNMYKDTFTSRAFPRRKDTEPMPPIHVETEQDTNPEYPGRVVITQHWAGKTHAETVWIYKHDIPKFIKFLRDASK